MPWCFDCGDPHCVLLPGLVVPQGEGDEKHSQDGEDWDGGGDG